MLCSQQKLESLSRFWIYTAFAASAFTIAGAGIAAHLILLLFILRSLRQPQLWNFNIPLAKPCAAMIIIAVISAYLNPDLKENLFNLRDFWRFLLPFILWKSFEGIQHDKLLKIYWWFLLWMAMYGIIQYFFGVDWGRPEGKHMIMPYLLDGVPTGVFHAKGNFTHHLTYSHYLLLVFPIYLSVSMTPQISRKYRWLSGGGALLILTALVLSLGRSAWIGALIALGILTLRLPRKWVLLCCGAGILGLGLLFLQIKLNQPWHFEETSKESGLKIRLESMFVRQMQSDRLAVWDASILAIKEHFWWGIGWGNNEKVMPQYRQQVTEEQGHHFYNQARAGSHNIYLQIWVYLGIVGLLSYLWLWWSMLFWNYQTMIRAANRYPLEKSILWGIQAGFIGFLAGGIFENNFLDGETQGLVLSLFGWSLALRQTVATSHR